MTLKRLVSILVAVIICANICFWILVGINFSSVHGLYVDGTVVRLGPAALVFGHGSWSADSGVVRHYTTVHYRREEIHTPTLQFVTRLKKEGVRWVWGTWCFSGDNSFIEKDLVTGEQISWPKFVSRNTTPGKTLPLWIGTGFIRLSRGERDPSGVVSNIEVPTDSVIDVTNWAHRDHDISLYRWAIYTLEGMFYNSNQEVVVDSIVGLKQDTVFRDFSRGDQAFQKFEKLPNSVSEEVYNRERDRVSRIREEERADYEKAHSEATLLLKTQAWIHNKPFPIWFRVPPVTVYGF